MPGPVSDADKHTDRDLSRRYPRRPGVQLRDVQRALREDIDRLEAVVKFINIGMVPVLFGLILIVAALVLRVRRRRRSQRGVRTATTAMNQKVTLGDSRRRRIVVTAWPRPRSPILGQPRVEAHRPNSGQCRCSRICVKRSEPAEERL